MDAADLERQARTLSGCIPPPLVARLLELGHEQEVESQAGQGEWFCARAWAQLLGERGRQDSALEVLAPYVATGWWPAAQFQAELLEGWGRAQEAIALTRPYAQAGDRMALDFVGRLLARHDRGAEAFELLRSGVEDWFPATALVDVAEAAGRDEDAAALLTAWIPADHRCDTPWWDFFRMRLPLMADCGLLDEAIEQARAHHEGDTGYAAWSLSDLLAEAGRTEEAVAVLEQHPAFNSPVPAQRLIDLGRINDAVRVLQNRPPTPGPAPTPTNHRSDAGGSGQTSLRRVTPTVNRDRLPSDLDWH
ncbi:hypothetical protein ACFZDG_26855 [Kitasatospora xanthocidica]|uniref:hypothetical protein n=1 Tax=Kitasatospora xanthocidica TaxID=83382 RepID=UPI0036E42002